MTRTQIAATQKVHTIASATQDILEMEKSVKVNMTLSNVFHFAFAADNYHKHRFTEKSMTVRTKPNFTQMLFEERKLNSIQYSEGIS